MMGRRSNNTKPPPDPESADPAPAPKASPSKTTAAPAPAPPSPNFDLIFYMKIEYSDEESGAEKSDDDDEHYRTRPRKIHAYLNAVYPNLREQLKTWDLVELYEDPDIVDLMVRYIETGTLDVDPESIGGFLEMAVLMDLDKLVNAWEMRDQAIFNQDLRVLDILNNYIKSNFELVTNHTTYLEKPKEEIVTMFKNWPEVAPSLDEVMRGYRKWIAHNPFNRQNSYAAFHSMMRATVEPQPDRPDIETWLETQTQEGNVDVEMEEQEPQSLGITLPLDLETLFPKPTPNPNAKSCPHCEEEISPHESLNSHLKEHITILKYGLDTLMKTPRLPRPIPSIPTVTLGATEQEPLNEVNIDMPMPAASCSKASTSTEKTPKPESSSPTREPSRKRLKVDSIKECQPCKKVFAGPSKLHRHNAFQHSIVHESLRKYVCTECNKFCGDSSKFKNHVNNHLKNPKTQAQVNKECQDPISIKECKPCKQVFDGPSKLHRHNAYHHSIVHESLKKYVCTECNKFCGDSTYKLRKHMNVHHKKPKTKVQGKKECQVDSVNDKADNMPSTSHHQQTTRSNLRSFRSRTNEPSQSTRLSSRSKSTEPSQSNHHPSRSKSNRSLESNLRSLRSKSTELSQSSRRSSRSKSTELSQSSRRSSRTKSTELSQSSRRSSRTKSTELSQSSRRSSRTKSTGPLGSLQRSLRSKPTGGIGSS